jgi:hypothetical protein
VAVGEFNDDVGTPRLTCHEWLLPLHGIDEQSKIVSDSCHLVAGVGLGGVAMATLVDRNYRMTCLGESPGHAIPKPGIRCQAVHEETRRKDHAAKILGRLPAEASEFDA